MVKRLQAYSGMLLLAVIASLTTIPSYILDTGSGTHWSMQITLFGYFSLGWLLYRKPEIIASWQARWRLPLLAAAFIMPICAWASRARLFKEDSIDIYMGVLAGITNGVIGIFMTVALIGYFYAHLNKPHRILELLGQSSYWVYLIHFPIVVAAGGLVSVLDMPALLKYFATLAIAIVLIALSYFTLVLGTPLKHAVVGRTR